MGKLTDLGKRLFRLDNAFALTVVIAALITALQIPQSLGIDPQVITATLLGLLAVDMLVERVGILKDIHADTTSAISRLDSLHSVSQFFKAYELGMPPLGRYLEGASDIWMCGITLGRTITSNLPLLQRKAKLGSRLRFAIIDPDPKKPPIYQASARSKAVPTSEGMLQHLRLTLANLQLIRDAAQSWETVDIRKLAFVPPYSLVVLDGNTARGRIFVELYCYKVAVDEDPGFELTPEDGHWYHFFYEQAKSILDDAEVLGFPVTSAPKNR